MKKKPTKPCEDYTDIAGRAGGSSRRCFNKARYQLFFPTGESKFLCGTHLKQWKDRSDKYVVDLKDKKAR